MLGELFFFVAIKGMEEPTRELELRCFCFGEWKLESQSNLKPRRAGRSTGCHEHETRIAYPIGGAFSHP
jgi:hypothetical protein